MSGCGRRSAESRARAVEKREQIELEAMTAGTERRVWESIIGMVNRIEQAVADGHYKDALRLIDGLRSGLEAMRGDE